MLEEGSSTPLFVEYFVVCLRNSHTHRSNWRHFSYRYSRYMILSKNTLKYQRYTSNRSPLVDMSVGRIKRAQNEHEGLYLMYAQGPRLQGSLQTVKTKIVNFVIAPAAPHHTESAVSHNQA